MRNKSQLGGKNDFKTNYFYNCMVYFGKHRYDSPPFVVLSSASSKYLRVASSGGVRNLSVMKFITPVTRPPTVATTLVTSSITASFCSPFLIKASQLRCCCALSTAPRSNAHLNSNSSWSASVSQTQPLLGADTDQIEYSCISSATRRWTQMRKHSIQTSHMHQTLPLLQAKGHSTAWKLQRHPVEMPAMTRITLHAYTIKHFYNRINKSSCKLILSLLLKKLVTVSAIVCSNVGWRSRPSH